MKIISLFDIDNAIKVNNLKEVTSQRIYRSQNMFDPAGLFSESIFGQTNDERNYTCAFIKLPIHVFNPDVAKTIIARGGGIIRKLAYAECRCDLRDGQLIASQSGKYCGFKDLYDIWDQIDIDKTLQSANKDNMDILRKTPKRLLFNDKVYVLPPNFRPVGMRNGRAVKSELNTMYMRILGLKSVTSHTTSNIHQVYNKFQDALIELYTYLNTYCSTKSGFFQRELLSKTTMWTARNVISAPSYKTNKPPVGIYHTGIPLDTVCSLFYPFVKFKLREFFSYNNLSNIHPNKDEVKQTDISNIYDDKMIGDLLHIYCKNPGSRFMPLYLDPEKTKPLMFNGYDTLNKQPISRIFTLTDAIYQCAKSVSVDADRHVYIVRYPIGQHLGMFFSKIHLMSTIETTEVDFMGEHFEHYPVINLELKHNRIATAFMTTITPSNSRLKAIGGDYDGDTIKCIGIWSDEANEEAERLMLSKIYNIKTDCDTPFTIEIECLNGLYTLTKD